MSKKAFEKIKWCIGDIDEFIDLIEINDSSTSLGKRYKLWKGISGGKIINRVENLIIACWSAKDVIKKHIAKEIGEQEAKAFETALYMHSSAELIQYLADSFKHGGINDKYLKQNKFKSIDPKLGKTFVYLVNNAFPSKMKPFFKVKGNGVPVFHIEQVLATIKGETHYNFDTIVISIDIIDKDNKTISHAMAEVNEYIKLLTKEYEKFRI